jgi:hypothetical protein
MNESYQATLTLWPATTLPAGVAHELHELGVNLSTFTVKGGSLTASRTDEGALVLEVSFERCRYGLSDLEAALATLRLACISYVAWDVKHAAVAGTGRYFDPLTRIEHEFTVTPDGKPVLRASDLEKLEWRRTAGVLIEGIRRWLRLPVPDSLEDVDVEELSIVILPDEDEEADEPVEVLDGLDGAPGTSQRAGHEGGR